MFRKLDIFVGIYVSEKRCSFTLPLRISFVKSPPHTLVAILPIVKGYALDYMICILLCSRRNILFQDNSKNTAKNTTSTLNGIVSRRENHVCPNIFDHVALVCKMQW